jgi:UDP-N-acetylmuramoyl-L-alanyl-D-glutamate--2,6-diaminopimelate ligase
MRATLRELVHGLDARIEGFADASVRAICYDSRRVREGSLFAALRGHTSDGHRFVPDAVAAGASALLVEEEPPALPAHVGAAIVPSTRAALPEVAARFFGRPADHLRLVGVTGTNGKSSTVRMIESILTSAGIAAGSIGTISVRGPGFEEPAGLTTPESVDLQQMLARMRDAGARTVALEVSSHSLALGRVRTLRFAAAVYTHLSQDHLDFHADMDDYAQAKALLFGPEYLAGPAVLNERDARTPELARRVRAAGQRVITYGRGTASRAEVRTREERIALAGSRLGVEHEGRRHEVELALPGDFQVENALAAIAAALALGIDWEAIRRGLASCPQVPGRLERVRTRDDDPVVLVDYAHTPDALDRVLGSIRPLARGRLLTVFGCGGDRDPSKRAPMARAACAHSDIAVATSDNPRTEDPDAILREVATGLSGAYEVIADRRAAIRRAIDLAREDDVVVIAGKGHEDYQIVGREKRPFDDREEARKALELRAERRSRP